MTKATDSAQTPLIETRGLTKYFDTPSGKLHAVDGVSFAIQRGRTLGVVGESGCGKTTVGRTLLMLQNPTSGQILYNGDNIAALSKNRLKALRAKLQIIFQDPFSSLNPRMTVFEAIAHPLIIHGVCRSSAQAEPRVLKLMEMVGLTRRMVNVYPHELDGGRRQRVVIARSLALEPEFIVCDEPVSALDVSIQAQILNLLQDLQESIGLTYLFITHNLAVVKHFSNEIAVMYLGQVVETASSDSLFAKPIHPYTRALISAIPSVNIHARLDRVLLRGEITSPINPKPGCRFAPRCAYAAPECVARDPSLDEVESGHFVACVRRGEF